MNADRRYKAKWLKIIDSLPTGGSNSQVIEARDRLESGYILWPGQEKYLLELKKQKPVNSLLTQPLPVDELRDMWRQARKEGDRDSMETIKQLGLRASKGELPNLAEVMSYLSLKKELGL